MTGVRIQRNWANQLDSKSDLVKVFPLSKQDALDFIDLLVKTGHHFHYFANFGGNDNSITVSESVFRAWQSHNQKTLSL